MKSEINNLKNLRMTADKRNQKICFVSGIFNLIHPGHLRLLAFAREFADILVVGCLPDNVKGVNLDQMERLRNVSRISWIDKCMSIEGNLEDSINALKPNFIVKGFEHLVASLNCKLLIHCQKISHLP